MTKLQRILVVDWNKIWVILFLRIDLCKNRKRFLKNELSIYHLAKIVNFVALQNTLNFRLRAKTLVVFCWHLSLFILLKA